MMKRITDPIDGLTLIRQAITFGNMGDVSDVSAVCKRLRVLPPGAPYWINRRGVVFEAPRKKQDFAAIVIKVHTAMRDVLAAVVAKQLPAVGQPTRTSRLEVWRTSIMNDGERVHERKPTLVAHLDFTFPSPYWFRSQGFDRSSGEDYIIPTLDGLLAASATVLYRHRHRLHIRKCPFCPTYFALRGKKQSTCGKVACKKEHIKGKNRKSQAAKRARDRQLLRGNLNSTKRLCAR